MARLMLALDWRTSFRQRVIGAFASDSRLFARMLAMHVGELSAPDLARIGVSLGWRMVDA